MSVSELIERLFECAAMNDKAKQALMQVIDVVGISDRNVVVGLDGTKNIEIDEVFLDGAYDICIAIKSESKFNWEDV